MKNHNSKMFDLGLGKGGPLVGTDSDGRPLHVNPPNPDKLPNAGDMLDHRHYFLRDNFKSLHRPGKDTGLVPAAEPTN